MNNFKVSNRDQMMKCKINPNRYNLINLNIIKLAPFSFHNQISTRLNFLQLISKTRI